jgi:hypothetical protein
MRALVAPFVSAESLPDVHDLLRGFAALGVPDVDAVWLEEVVAGVNG